MTPCFTIVLDDSDRVVVTMYRDNDGYPEAHGQELAHFLSGVRIVDAVGPGQEGVANGMACLAAQIVAHFKNKTGSIDVSDRYTEYDLEDDENDQDEDDEIGGGYAYVYVVTHQDDELYLRIKHRGTPLWHGPANKFDCRVWHKGTAHAG